MFPDEFDPAAPGNKLLQTKTSNPRVSHGLAVISNQASGENADQNQGSDQNREKQEKSDCERKQKKDQSSNQREGGNQGSGSNRGRRPRLGRPRLMATGPKTATMAFTPADEPQQSIKIVLTPAGSEWGQESPVQIVGAKVVSPQGQPAEVSEGSITLTPQSAERIVIEISTSDPINQSAFRIG